MSRFHMDSPTSLSDDDEDNLPYPTALPRSDFLSLAFDAPTYLSALSHRHQTLEDLRSDLKERSQALSKELLDLVNTNYEQFLSLGSDLKGGEVKVEDVRVGLLAFRRGIADVKKKVTERRVEVEGLLGEKRTVGREIIAGRTLLEVNARLEELEDRLMVDSLGGSVDSTELEAWSDSEEDENKIGEDSNSEDTRKLHMLVLDFRTTERLASQVGIDHPCSVSQQPRMQRVRNTLLLDLKTTLKQAVLMGESGNQRIARIIGMYSDLDADHEAVKVLRDLIR